MVFNRRVASWIALYVCCLTASNAFASSTSGLSTTVVTVVDLTEVPDNATAVAVAAACGLLNRESASYYYLRSGYDSQWLTRLVPNATLVRVAAYDFLASLLLTGRFDVVLYNSDELYSLPAVMTIAGVLDLVPLSTTLAAASFQDVAVAFNASSMWTSQLEAVTFAAALVLNRTTSTAFQRPTDLAQGFLVDFIVQRRLFVQYLSNGCIPLTEDNKVLKSIVDESPWPRPIRVYGYNGLDVLFGGDLFEAETDCVNTMGQVATETAMNLAFWSNVDRLVPGEQLQQAPPPTPPAVYNASKIYVALVYGDMDNIDFVQTFGSDHMEYRAAQCSTPANKGHCFPLTWTLSPNLIDLSPAMMRWYYRTALTTGGRDWFIMPPSGTLYAYPGMMDNDTQALYVRDQSAQAYAMNTSGSVHWEWFFAWDGAWDTYFPRYQSMPLNTPTTRAFFLNDVPYVIPIPDMWLEGQTYRFVGDPQDASSVVGFKPAFNWQEGGGGGNPGNASTIAKLMNAFAIGSVQYVYCIQNTPVQSVFELTTLLAENVELVGYEDLVSLARQREALFDERRRN